MAIADDRVISQSDLPGVMRAKYELLGRDGVLSFECETVPFAEIGGLRRLRKWLEQRRNFFLDGPEATLDPPRGILLLGVQGCGKSLAAKAAAGIFAVPLLRLDFGALYNKYYGEAEKNLRPFPTECRRPAPCVLWMDEIEVGSRRRRRRWSLPANPRDAADLDGGTAQLDLPGRHCQRHRPPAPGTGPQKPLRRNLLRGPARHGDAAEDTRHPGSRARW